MRRMLLPRLAAVLALGLVLVGLPGVTKAVRAEAGTGQDGVTVAGQYLPNRTAVREENSFLIYQIVNGGKLWFQNADELYALGYTLPMVVMVPVGTLAAVPDVPGDGAMIKERSDAHIYYVEAGVKHWVTGPDVLQAVGYTYADVTTIADRSASLVPRGHDITMLDFSGGDGSKPNAVTGYKHRDTDAIHTATADAKARVTGGVYWSYGSGVIPVRRGDIMSGSKAEAVASVGCIWAQVRWTFPQGSVSYPAGVAGSEAEDASRFLRSCRSSGQSRPAALNLAGIDDARRGLYEVTITVCTSVRASDGPRYCGRDVNSYGGA